MAGYTRQDTANNIANGNVIDADDFDAEYNAVEAAFNASSGHKHDGTAGEGAPITKVGPSQDIIVSATNVNPKTTNTLDLGVSAGVKFKNGYFQGTLVGETAVKAGTNRYMTLTDNELDVSTGDLTIDVEGAIVIDANGGDITLKDDGTTFGGISNSLGQTVIKSGTTPTTAITFSDADATLAGNTTVSGTLDVTGDTNFNSTTTSTSKTTGAVIIDGGVGIAENVNIGGNVAIDGDLAVSGTGKNITGNLIGDVKAANGTSVLDSGTDGTDATFTGNSDTASTWETSREIALTGDVTGTVTGVNGGGNISIATTMAGDHVASLVAGTGVTLADNSGAGATPTISIGQAVATDSNVQFNNVTVDGNLTVGGTTTTVNSTTVTVDDPVFTLGGDTAPISDDNKDRGIEFNWHNGTDAKVGFFGFDDSEGKFTFIPDATNTSEVFSGDAGTIVANLEGTASVASSASSTGDFTVDSGGDIILDAAGEQVYFKKDGTTSLTFNLDATPSIAATGALEISSNSSITATTGSAIVIDTTSTSAASSIRLNSGSGVTRFGTSGLETFRIEQGTAYGGPIKLYATHHVTGALEEQIRLTNYGVNIIEGLRVGDTTQPTDNDIYAVADIEAGNDLTAGNDVTASNDVTAGNDVVVSNDIRMTAGVSDWKFEVGASNEVLISYGGTNMFKLDSSGNLTVRGNVTAFDTSL
jgi:hypothetical protein